MYEQESKSDPGQANIQNETSDQTQKQVIGELGEGTPSQLCRLPPSTPTGSQHGVPSVTEGDNTEHKCQKHKKAETDLGKGTLSQLQSSIPASSNANRAESKHKRPKHKKAGVVVSEHTSENLQIFTSKNSSTVVGEMSEGISSSAPPPIPAKLQLRAAAANRAKAKSKRQRRKKDCAEQNKSTHSQLPITSAILSELQCYVLASGDNLIANSHQTHRQVDQSTLDQGVFSQPYHLPPSTSANLVHYVVTSGGDVTEVDKYGNQGQMQIRSELGEGTSFQPHHLPPPPIAANLLRYIPVETRGQSQKDQQVTAGNGDSTYSQSHNVHPSTTTSNILCYDATAPLFYDTASGKMQPLSYHSLPSTSTSSQIYIPARGDTLSFEAKQLINKYKKPDANERSKFNQKQQFIRNRKQTKTNMLGERTFRPIAPLPPSEPPPLKELTVKPKIKCSTPSAIEGAKLRMCESPVLEFKKMKIEPKFYQVNRKPERLRQKRFRPEPGDSRSHSQHTHHTQQQQQQHSSATLAPIILDSGGHTIKMGLATDSAPKIIPNAIMKVKSEKKRLFIGNQIEECRDLSGLYFLLPCERGYITKWEVQKPIWDYAFNKGVSIEDRCVIMTQPPFNFKSIQDCLDELFFEDYEVKAMYRANPSDFARYEYSANVIKADEPCLVVDSGFSFTHIMPYIDGRKYYKGIKRVNIGGKFLTNYLRDIISYRMYDVMEETYVINQVKEDCVFVSMDVREELKKAKLPAGQNPISINYVLPDFNMIRRGYIQNMNENDEIAENCQILRLNNERFTVPELLFNPKDIGMTSIGVAEAVAKSILSCPASVRPSLAKNIILTGGNVRIPGFEQRLQVEVRSFLPENYTLKTYKPDNPVTFAWKGGKSLAHDPRFKQLIVTKQEYEEHGSKITYERFNAWTYIADDAPPKPVECVPINYMEHLKLNSVFEKDDETPSVTEERPVFIEDPGEGPSSRSDVTAPVIIRPEEDEKSESSMASEDDATRSSEPSAKSAKVSCKQGDGDDIDENLGNMIRDAEMEAMMECVKAYI